MLGAATVLPRLVSRQLRQCEEDKEKLRERLSAVETTCAVLRKLVPAGEWARLLADHLGLDPSEADK